MAALTTRGSAAPLPRRKSVTDGGPAAEAARSVLRRFRVVANTVRQTSRGLTAGAGLSSARVRVLIVLRDHPGLGVAELARKLSIHSSTASNVLRPLLEEGLVSSRRNPDDRRLVQLRATARGLRALASAPVGVGVLLHQALRRLDAATLARLERDLGQVVEALDAADLAAMEPAPPATRKRAA